LPAESQFPYNFATVYNCGFKGFSNLKQKASVNVLLTSAEPKAGEVRNLSDSVCSNYVKGKTDLGDDLRIELLSLDIPTIENRINLAGIQNLTKVAQSLYKLVEISDLIREDQIELEKSFREDQPIHFIAKALQKSFRPSNYCILGNERIEELRRIPYEIGSDRSSGNSVSEEAFQYETETISEESEDREWLSTYLSGAPINSSLSFIRKELQVTNVPITLPLDYTAMVYALKPTIMDGAIEAFEFDEFVKAMDIDTVNHIARSGHLEYWLIRGEMEYIEALIPKLNFFNVSDFAFQFIGKFVLKDVRKMQETLLKSSNPYANLLSTLVNDKNTDVTELRLFTHVCEEKVIEQHEANGVDYVKPYTFLKELEKS
jgi:hypothetical protein